MQNYPLLMALLNKIFSTDDSPEGKAIGSLMSSEECKRQILKQAAQEVMASEVVFAKYPHEQLLAIAMTAIKSGESGFASDEEAYLVGNIFCKHIKTKNILPRVTDYYRDDEEFFSAKKSNIELGEKCLVSLSLFEEAIKRRKTPLSFLTYVGIREFTKEGLQEIANHFSLWTKMFQDYTRKTNEKYISAAQERYLINLTA